MQPTRQIGTHGPRVSTIGFGCMALAGSYGAAPQVDAARIVGEAADAGVTHFDTADVYGGGTNETLIGSALKPWRDKVVVATKGGATRGLNGTPSNNGRPDYLKKACEASLRRLGMDCIDLYYLHRVDPEVPIEESVGALAQLVQKGKVRWIGLSEVAEATLRRAHAVHPISAVQTEYSLTCRHVESGILSACQELGVGFVAYSPLGRGMLSGGLVRGTAFQAGDVRLGIPRFSAEHLDSNLVFADEFGDAARELGLTPSQLALAWVLAQAEHIVTIPGTRRAARLHENMQASRVTLPHDVARRIGERFGPQRMHGARHSAQMLSRTDL